jgi:hypothetical protein
MIDLYQSRSNTSFNNERCSDTARIELATRIGYPSNQYQDQRSEYAFYLINNGDQSKRFRMLNNNNY